MSKVFPGQEEAGLTRRRLLQGSLAFSASLLLSTRHAAAAEDSGGVRPNIILAMTDDQGWGDTSYNGHPVLKTPTLDAMAESGIRFDRFYSGAPVCSPTRGSCLTGRHPYRYGILGANAGNYDAASRYPLPAGEITLAEVLRKRGYTTGHFGKWHLGDFAGELRSTPADNGFDQSFSTVRKVPTVNPFDYYLNGEPYTEPLEGDDNVIVMDRTLRFVEDAIEAKRPFFVVLWFHAPHEPVLATEPYKKLFESRTEDQQNFWGTVSSADHELGRLRDTLRRSGVADDTMLWFCSDNGPASSGPGSSGGLREGKGTLYEGGVRVPGILEWPRRITQAKRCAVPCSTSDYFPTIAAMLGLSGLPDRPCDGISLAPVIDGGLARRGKPLFFWHQGRGAMIDENLKLIIHVDAVSQADDELYDLAADPAETKNLVASALEDHKRMRVAFHQWQASVKHSATGADYSS